MGSMSGFVGRFFVGLALSVAAVLGFATSASAFTVNGSDLDFILEQIKRAEAHAAGGDLLGQGQNQIPSPLLPYGLRTVNGEYNNIVPGQEDFGSADRLFPRLGGPPAFRPAEPFDPDGPGPLPASPTSYGSANAATSGLVSDSEPRTISNLIVDVSNANPAAVAVAADTPGSTGPAPADPVDPSTSFFLPNQAPDAGLSAPYNSWFTLFGQFFDHGLDLTTKGGSGTVVVPLKADDPLFDPGSQTNFMVLTRATNQAGSDGLIGTEDDVREHTNTTTPFVDQNQTYTSHPSHQVFLREFELNGAGEPVATGRLLERAGVGGLATWADVKQQARTMLGIDLDDQDVLNLPLLLTDEYGKFIPDPATGFAQIVTDEDPLTLDSGTPASPVDASAAVRTKHAFLDDIAHHAVPFGDHDNDPSTPRQPLSPDPEPSPGPTNTADDNDPATYDDELLNVHFVTGDGRGNENIGLTAVHHIFHAEHNLEVDKVKNLILEPGPPNEADWQLSPGVWNGERLFQAARFITEMQYQHLVFEEFARKVQPQVNLFAGYETDIDPAIQAEFAHAAYRFGHSMLTEDIARTNADGSNNDIGLIQGFLNPEAFNDGGPAGALTPEQAAGSIARGMTEQRGNEIDEFVTGALRNNLVGLPLDLATINITRGRDTGVPPLNALRRTFYADTSHPALVPYESWADFGLGMKNPESLVNFVAAYGLHPTIEGATTVADKRAAAELIVNGGPGAPADRVDFMQSTPGSAWQSDDGGVTTTGVDEIDLWVGGLAEKQMPFGGLLGSTFNYIFERQMEQLQDGDRLYYLGRTAGLNFLTELEANSFAELIRRTTDASHLPADVFSDPDYRFELANLGSSGPILDDPNTTGYDESTLLTRSADGTVRFAGVEHVLFGGTPGNDRIRSSEGDDTFWADGGDDRVEGGAGNDLINGGDGNDTLLDEFGDDNIKGGAGDDVMSAGSGFDLLIAGADDDFVVAGADPKETFGGLGDDYIYAGDSSDVVFGDGDSDWIEGGPQADLLQGDFGDPFQEGRTGDDVIDGGPGNDDYDSEGGDDIMISGPGVERHEGMIGFDWVTHRGDPQGADSDLTRLGLLPPDIDNIRDRFDLVEAVSGWNHNDILAGDNATAATMAGDHELTNPALIDGLSAELLGGAGAFTGGNILIGGGGSDRIEGRGGNDIIDGDRWLDAQISVRSLADPSVEINRVDNMGAIQAQLFSGAIKPSQLRIVRTIKTGASGPGVVDTAVFSDVLANYDIEPNLSTQEMTITHVGGTATDGSDTVRNIERLQFADQLVQVTDPPGNGPPTGNALISDTTPTENQVLTASRNFGDPNGVDAASIVYTWELEEDPGVFEPITSGTTFTPSDEEVGLGLRVKATYRDNAGVLETVVSDVTAPVANVNDVPVGQPGLSDTTPIQGQLLTATAGGIGDADGLEGVAFSYQWQEDSGSGFVDIVDANAASFTPGPPQVGASLRVRVSYTDNNGTAEQVFSVATAAVGPLPPAPPPADALRVTDLFVPASAPADRAAPFVVHANVPEGASVVQIRVIKASAKRSGKNQLVAKVVRQTPEAGRYQFRLRDTKQLRHPKPGRYLIEVRAGSSLESLGAAESGTIIVKKQRR